MRIRSSGRWDRYDRRSRENQLSSGGAYLRMLREFLASETESDDPHSAPQNPSSGISKESQNPLNRGDLAGLSLVVATGFEPATSCSRSKRAKFWDGVENARKVLLLQGFCVSVGLWPQTVLIQDLIQYCPSSDPMSDPKSPIREGQLRCVGSARVGKHRLHIETKNRYDGNPLTPHRAMRTSVYRC